MLCVALYFVVRYAGCSVCMYCNVLLVNQCGGESLGQLGEGLGRTQGGSLHVSETVLGVAGVTGVCFGWDFCRWLRVSVTWFWSIKSSFNY